MSKASALSAEMFVVTVTSHDRVGIVRDLTQVLKSLDANIERVTQTVVMNHFTLTVVIRLPKITPTDDIMRALHTAAQAMEFEVSVKTIEPGSTETPAVTRADLFILTVTGNDRKGVLSQMAAYLAGKGVNILELNVDKPDDTHFVMISQLAVPHDKELRQIQLDLQAMAKRDSLTIALQHENIFRATNEVTAPATFFAPRQ